MRDSIPGLADIAGFNDPPSRTLRVGVVGLGYFSQFHLDAWRRIEGASIVAVHDADPRRCAQVSGARHVKTAPDLDALLDERLDVLDVVTPSSAHASIVRAALHRVPVIVCQKPFCTSVAEAEGVARAARLAGAQLVVHENFRFQPWHRAVRSFLDTGAMGAIHQMRFALRPGDGRGKDAYAARQPAFRTMPRLLIHETLVHLIDLSRWLVGEHDHVYAETRRLNPVIAGEDDALVVLGHANGARTVLDGNRLADHVTDLPRRTMGTMEIEGEGGTLTLDGMGRVSFRPFGSQAWEDVPVTAPVDDAAFGGGCTEALCRHVVEAVRGRVPFENRAADYLPVMRTVEAAYRSAETGCRVALDG